MDKQSVDNLNRGEMREKQRGINLWKSMWKCVENYI